MYDASTKSLWNTLTGEPVIGPLVGLGIMLESLPVVTTTWEDWHHRHPETRVLSLSTGHERDYGEGVAYADYFSSDRLMFPVPAEDSSRPNKLEVLVIRTKAALKSGAVYSCEFLRKNPVYPVELAGERLVILTDKTGGNRVYESRGRMFSQWNGGNRLYDERGESWTVREQAMLDSLGNSLRRVSAHRSFWFAWHAMHPDARIVE